MATIDDYFSIDSNHNITIESESELTDVAGNRLAVRMFQNLGSGSFHFAIRIPKTPDPVNYCLSLLGGNLVDAVVAALPKLTVSSHQSSHRPVDAGSLRFCGRIYIYSGQDIPEEAADQIFGAGQQHGLFIEYFGPNWATERSKVEKPRAFISHDTRDKSLIARPLALKLSSLGVRVWFDEFTLKLGDSLRESIERGIRETDYCILILTRNYISNQGWTKAEFNAVFSKENHKKDIVMLPVWHDISSEEIYEYSPSLLDRFAAKWNEGVEAVAAKIKTRVAG